MARLTRFAGDESCQLAEETLIGRSSVCRLQLNNSEVSKQHAIINWTRRGWSIRDLGSRNGTFVDGRRLEHGEEVVLLADTELRFGRKERWILDSAAPPALVAETVDEGEPQRVSGEQMLTIVSGEELIASISCDLGGRWILETGETFRVLTPGETFEVGGRRWCFRAPEIASSTEASTWAPRVTRARIRFSYVNETLKMVRVEVGERVHEFERRGHHQLLLALAELRERDRKQGVDEPEAGWISHVELRELLSVTRNYVNVNVHRVRKQFEDAGFTDAACVIERRRGSGKLRIGIREIEFEREASSAP